ncbi:MAG TPA: Holliday junction resolvase RecU [Bacillota bacterium]|nr:Holliday junction resolvase RecU [Bacillota bacterium]
MIRYPILRGTAGVKRPSTANRGMDLEAAINATNDYYAENDIAYIYKKPVPIQIVKVDYERRSAARISEAYYKIPSTTDYNGIYRGRYIDFEAKETKTKTAFPMKNIHEHQVLHLDHIVRHGGIGFIIVAFTTVGKTFLLDASHVVEFYRRADEGRKSIAYDEFERFGHEIPEGYIKRLDYLKIVDSVYFSQ